MAGIKGKSGRKSRRTEVQEGRLEKVCTDYLLDNFETFDKQTKLKIALNIASKAVTQKTENTSKVEILEEQASLIHNHIRKLTGQN